MDTPHFGLDFVLPFQLDRSQLRGRFVRLGPVLDQILRQHAYPEPVARLLAEVVVTAAALASTLKYDGVFTLQTKSDGIVRFLVADVTSEGGVRAYAQFDADRLASTAEGTDLLGKGYLAFTADLSASTDRYQGVVELDGLGIADAIQRYFRQSEQIPTGFVSFVDLNGADEWRGGCILLQRLAREGGHALAQDTSEEDDWLRAMTLLQTCTKEELLDQALSSETLLYRLFHEEEPRVYESKALEHRCRCSRERVEGMLRGMPEDEAIGMLEDNKIDVTCAFCNKTYTFNEGEVRALFAVKD